MSISNVGVTISPSALPKVHDDVEILVNIKGDAQDTVERNASNLVGKRLSAFAAQMGTLFPAHGYTSRNCIFPTHEARAG